MNILGITLARGGSKGVPGKHTRLLGGKPVIAWTIEAALAAKSTGHLSDYYVSSDDNDILTAARKAGARCIRRPQALAQDTTPTINALVHAVDAAESITLKTYDYIVEIRATSPFKTADDIRACVEILIRCDCDSVIGVSPLSDHHPARIKWLDEYNYIHDFIPEPKSGRRQDCIPPAYIRNGTIYALRRKWVMETPELFGHAKSRGYIMPEDRSINIDTEMDWKLCELLADHHA